MVKLNNIRISNRSLQELPPGLVAVFVGATSGIGLATLKQFARNTNGARAYIIGRSREKVSHIIDALKCINPMGTFVFVEGQFSLIKEVDRISEQINKLEDHIDILCMSPGYLSLGDTPEGIETDFALQYYSRQRLVLNMIPLLEHSASPRVISILAAGFEGPIDIKNLDCRQHYSFARASRCAATMTDLIFEHVAKRHPTISFIHSFPGRVGTHILDHMLVTAPRLLWYPALIPRYTIVPLYTYLLCISADEAGERNLFLVTSAKYPAAKEHELTRKIGGWADLPYGVGPARATVMKDGVGNGVYRTTWDGESCKENKLLDGYREDSLGRLVYEHTMGVFEKAAKADTGNVRSKVEEHDSLDDEDSLDFDLDPEAVN
ncbi:putative short-chain dehydrogenases/reductase [Cadophora sp. DSE1049]|nr:putative short-chain dehydrogenases/reductase [Cadophora sp. DSE1049]